MTTRHTGRRRGASTTSPEASAWARDLDERALACRTMRHAWAPFRAFSSREGRRVTFTAVYRCGRCETDRHVKIDDRGYVLSSSYSYTDGYLAPPGVRLGEDGRAELRLLSFSRLLDTIADADADELAARRKGA